MDVRVTAYGWTGRASATYTPPARAERPPTAVATQTTDTTRSGPPSAGQSISDAARQIATAHATVTKEVDQTLEMVWHVPKANAAGHGPNISQTQAFNLVNRLGQMGNAPGAKTVALSFPDQASAEQFQQSQFGQQVMRLVQAVETYSTLSSQPGSTPVAHVVPAVLPRNTVLLNAQGKLAMASSDDEPSTTDSPHAASQSSSTTSKSTQMSGGSHQSTGR